MAWLKGDMGEAGHCSDGVARAALLLFWLVAGCAQQMGGPRYVGLPPLTVEEGGMRFVLRIRPDRAEAVRVSPMLPPDFNEVARRAQLVVARETGCAPAWVVGDPSMLEVGLSCPGKPVPRKPRARHVACDYLAAAGREFCG